MNPNMYAALGIFFAIILMISIFLQEPLYQRFGPDTDPEIFDLLTPTKQTSINNVLSVQYQAEEHAGILFCTMLSDDFHNYAHGAIRLVSTLKTDFPGMHSAVIELEEKRIPAPVWNKLQVAGWDRLITLHRIAPRHEGAELISRFKDQFTKLHLWNLTAYRWVFYMDSDVLIVRSLKPMVRHVLTFSTNSTTMWAIEDLPWFPGSFNAGILAVSPNATEFSLLMDLLHGSIQFSEGWAEQGFLNAVYQGRWQHLPIEFGLNLCFWSDRRDDWKALSRKTQAVHFTMIKPWDWFCPWTQYAPLCSLFWKRNSMQFHPIDTDWS